MTSPFAYGPSGRWLTSTQAHEVFICDGDDEHTVHVIELDATVTGVRNTPAQVLALDAQGTLYGLDPRSGKRAWTLGMGAPGLALAATEAGRWAAVHGNGVTWGEGSGQLGELEVAGARHAAFDPTGQTLAIVTEDGTLSTVKLGGALGPGRALGYGATGLAYSRLGWWLVSTTRGVFRVPVDGGEPELYLKWGGDDHPVGVTCSLNGRLCAFVTERKVVVLFGVERDANCGAIIYPEREVGELEFGPQAWLGIGLGLGDGNKVDLLDGSSCSRTDPPPGRPRNRWALQLSFDADEVGEVHGPRGAAPAPAAAHDGAAADPRTQWGATPDDAPSSQAAPTTGMLFYALGLLVAAGVLGYAAIAGWFDPFMAWLGAGILGVSGISIFAASRRG